MRITLSGDHGANVIDGGAGNDTIDGGAGASWTDTIDLLQDGMDGTALGEYGTDWIVSVSEGTIDNVGTNQIDLSDDADGTINLADGSTIEFQDVERIW